MDQKDLQKRFSKLYKSSKENLDQSESKLKSRFHKSEILEDLGYEEEDIKVEKSDERGKRTDIHCTDEYGNVSFIVEFKKPDVDVGRSKHKKQLLDRYMKPLKADFGILYNGLKVVAYRREGLNSEHLFTKRADNLGDKAKEIIKFAERPDYSLTKIDNVGDYFKKFDDKEEKLKLEEESAREHFFENFKLEKNSSFENLLISTIDLFEEMKGKNQFLDSAFRFWKESYAKKPEEVPSSWETIMQRSGLSGKSDLYEFMFCLETSYAVFARLIMAKSGEDYEFSEARFSDFIETEVRRASYQDDIALGSWAKVTQDLIERMRRKMVSSVFEEDIFYWWTEPYEDRNHEDFFHIKKIPKEVAKFGESLGKITLMIYKFNFSKIDGDPLGVLYQQYFDKETRKALGEFYTPQEVVDYILDSVDYKGRKVLNKRLLDPACGSGTFPVTALQRYLKAAENSGLAEDKGWDHVLDQLCNQYRIVGFDIHPFATIMAQIQFMLVLMPKYKKAREDAKKRGEHFKLQRIPIFRTDSLKDESKGENPTLDQFEGGEKFKMDVKLPVNKEEGGDFFDEEFAMPTPQAAREVNLYDNQEYFGALQAFFDIIKQQAQEMEGSNEIPQFARDDFEDQLRNYSLTGKEWSQISTLFQSFADNLLRQIKRLQSEFDDGRLIKSIEDIYLAALLKNEQKYDYVVGNPPYVRQEMINSKEELENRYPDVYQGRADLYVYFMRRALEWINERGKYGYITSGKFTKTNYGKYLRASIVTDGKIDELVDFRGISVFENATNDPVIITQDKNSEEIDAKVAFRDPDKDIGEVMSEIRNQENEDYMANFTYSNSRLEDQVKKTSTGREYIETFNILPELAGNLISKLKDLERLEEYFDVYRGIRTGRNSIFVVDEEKFGSKDCLRSVVRGNDVGSYYTPDSGERIIYATQETFDPDDYPEVRSYLEQNKEDKLLTRSQYSNRVEKGEDIKWWEIEQPLSPDIFEQDKIIAQRITQDYRFSLEKESLYTLETCTTVVPKDSENMEFFLGLLNSKLLEFFSKADGKSLGESGYELEKQFVERLPIKIGKEKEIGDRAGKIFTKKKLKNKIFNIEGYLGEEELENKTLKCNSGHPDMEPSIQTTQDGMFEVEVGKRKTDSILLDTEEKAKFVKKALEGDSASKGDEVEILVPRSNSDVKEILQEYEDDKEKLEEMPSVEELEEEINEMVYDLYDLDEEEIEVIEDFLEKF